MATRSNIAYKTEDGTIRSIYCHWDGYPAHNGEMLRRHYNDIEKIKALIELGSLSSLRPEIGSKQDFDDRKSQNEDWCLAYHRDRGEELSIQEYEDIPEWISEMEEYAYLWNGKEWLVNDHGEMRGGFPVFDFVSEKISAADLKAVGWD